MYAHTPRFGKVSGSCHRYEPGMKFSDVIADAKEKGFTEPDPRDDLAGTDVQRKVARTMTSGRTLSLLGPSAAPSPCSSQPTHHTKPGT